MPPRSQPLVSVVIPVYNAEPFLEQTIESVLAQTYQHFEILMVDDGSRDRSAEIARGFAKRYPQRIRLLRHPGGANRGVSASRNLACTEASGSLIAFLDADDLWLPGKLERQVQYMQENPAVGLSYTDASIQRDESAATFLPGIDVLGDPAQPEILATLLGVLTIGINYIFSTVIVRTEAIRAVGGFCEDLPFQSEDRIMVSMVASACPIARVPEVLALYRAHAESYTASVLRAKTANVIVFDMQARVILWQLDAGHRELGIRLAARLLPGSIMRSAPRVRPQTLRAWGGDLLKLGLRLPHLPLLVVRYHLMERAARWRRRQRPDARLPGAAP